MADIMENMETAVESTQQENLENMVASASEFDIKPIAIGMVAGATVIALAKPASKLAMKGAKWIWGKTGAKLVSKAQVAQPAEEAIETPEETAETSEEETEE